MKIPRAMAWDIGAAGEDLVFDYMRRTGHGVIQSSRFLGDDGRQAPRLLFEEDRGPVLPDLDVSKGGRRFWLEVKTYENAAMNRRHSSFVHGIKLRHYNDYLRVQADTGCPADLGVVEAATGAFLVGRIETMRRYPCQCRICVKAPAVEHEVYFDRHAFDLRHCFCDDEMRAVRAFYLSLNPKWRPEPPPRLTPHATPLPPPSPLPRQPALPGFE